MPGDVSTPDETSIPNGFTLAMTSPTFSGVIPPDSTTRRAAATVDADAQSMVRPVPPRPTGSYASKRSVTRSGQAATPSTSLAGLHAIALITGRVIAATYDGLSSPCN